MKVTCPVCGKVVGGYVPKGGDGSALRPRRHGDCEGRFELATEIVQESFQDAVRNDRTMTAEQKEYWLSQPTNSVPFCDIHEISMELTDYDDGSRYECPECKREDGEALGLM